MAGSLNRRLVTTTFVAATLSGVGAYATTRYINNNTAVAESHELQSVFGRGPAFKYLQLSSSEDVNHNTKRLRFELPGGQQSKSGLPLTSALLTFSKPGGSWLPAIRPYTPISKSDEPGFIDLLVKKYPNGKVSTHLHDMKPGDSLFILASIPGFKWTPNKFSHVYLIAGGAGITPIYQLAQSILDNPEDKTKVTVVFGVNTENDLLFRSEFDAFKQQMPDRFDIHYTVSTPGKDFTPGQGIASGYVNKDLLGKVMKGSDEGDAKIFVCGPPAMEASLVGKGETGVLGQLGYSNSSIHSF